MPKIIGFSGRIGSGKTQCAKYLGEKHGFTVDAYATVLKQGVSLMFGVPLANFYGNPEDRAKIDEYWGISFREMLQKFGTEAIRQTFGHDFWEKSLWRKHEFLESDIAIEDVRFPNEAEAILQRGGIIVEVSRGPATNEQAPWWKFWVESEQVHASEVKLPNHLITYEIQNDGTIEQLNMVVDRILDTHWWNRNEK